MSLEALAGLLARRLDESGRLGNAVVSVAELHRTLLPYHICRGSLGYATKAEYDVELLELLASERYLFPAETELRSAVSDERKSPEPGLGFLKNFAAAQLQIRPELSPVVPPPPTPAPPSRTRASAPEAPGSATAPAESESTAVGAAARSEPAEAGSSESRAAASAASPTCWKCDRALPRGPDVRYCVFCGSNQARPRCLDCNEELESEWLFCPRCGMERSPPAPG